MSRLQMIQPDSSVIYHIAPQSARGSIKENGFDNTFNHEELWNNVDDWDEGVYVWNNLDGCEAYMTIFPVDLMDVYAISSETVDLAPDTSGSNGSEVIGASYVRKIPASAIIEYQPYRRYPDSTLAWSQIVEAR